MRIVVLGAGPTGLGAAWRLHERGHTDWTLLERADDPGGLSSSVIDEAGFTWDLGGHVLFSHYRYFDDLMNRALGDQWVEHEREAWIWMRERWIPYPVQHNVWRLPPDELMACLEGLLESQRQVHEEPPRHFEEWLLRAFGRGLCDSFMLPYNTKVWAYQPAMLGVGWMGERVSTVQLERILRNLVFQRDDVSWGPNATFRFPLRGGTGAIWTSIANQLPASRLAFGKAVVRIETKARRVFCDDGTSHEYDRLISSIPLDELLRLISDQPILAGHAPDFVYSASHIVGIGFKGLPPQSLTTKCWMYFPEADTPFYRVTVFSNYSPHNVARPGEQWSLMAEVSESAQKPVRVDQVVDDVVAGFRQSGLVEGTTPIVTRFHRRLDHGYPTPWLGREETLTHVLPALGALGILSRGRFGAWRYEVSNQDHSCLQGVEAVDHVLGGSPETTVNGRMDCEPPALPS